MMSQTAHLTSVKGLAGSFVLTDNSIIQRKFHVYDVAFKHIVYLTI